MVAIAKDRRDALDRVEVAKPCPVDWESMTGNERVRACEQCSMNVYNLSGMTRDAARALVEEAEGRVCVRFFRRADGTVMTADCPVGLAAFRRRVAWIGSSLAASLLFLVGLLGFGVKRGAIRLPSLDPIPPQKVMGRMVCPPLPPPGPPQGS